MSEPGPPHEPLRFKKHLSLLFGAAGLLGLATFTLPRAALSFLGVVTGSFASATLLHFAWIRTRHARSFAGRASGSSQGRIVEHRDGDRVVFELPADGLEPWAHDAWVILVTALACALLGGSFGRPVLFGFLAVLIAAVAARLLSVSKDRIRLEVRGDGFEVHSSEGGRIIERFGEGALLPELAPEGLVLWSTSGRIGVLRGELTRAERAWLGGRLAALAESLGSTSRAPGAARASAPQGLGDSE